MEGVNHRFLETNGIRMHLAEQGAGALVAWHCALLRPDIFHAVVLLSVPYLQRSWHDIRPTDAMKSMAGELEFYQLYFQEAGKAEAELEADVRLTMRMFLYAASGDPPPEKRWRFLFRKSEKLLDTGSLPATLPSWLTEQDLDVFTSAHTEIALYLPRGKAFSMTGTVREPRDLEFDITCHSRGLLEYCVRCGNVRWSMPISHLPVRVRCKALHTPRLYDLIKDAKRVADITSYRFPTSVRRHYEHLTRFPEGFVVLGDAISSFNPFYGQGMSAAALQVQALQEVLTEREAESWGLDGLALAFFPKAAAIIDTPWTLAASQDLAYLRTQGERPADLEESRQYFAEVDTLTAEDVEVHRLVVEVLNLTKPLSALREEPLRRRVEARRRCR